MLSFIGRLETSLVRLLTVSPISVMAISFCTARCISRNRLNILRSIVHRNFLTVFIIFSYSASAANADQLKQQASVNGPAQARQQCLPSLHGRYDFYPERRL